ncbi:MAG: hypothetical protein U0V56_01035 [Actinomycetota bacterium]
MELTTHTEAIRSDLEVLAGSDEASQAAAERISRGLGSPLTLRLLDVLSQAALELSDQLPDGHVDVRLAGREARLIYVAQEVPEAPAPDDGSGTARLTLRMPEAAKAAVEAAADADGLSTNAWLVRAVSNELDRGRSRGRARRAGGRVTGFAQG